MSCEQRDELLNAMVDGQLGADARRSLETHLLDCPGCRARRDALEGLRRDLESAFAPEQSFAAGLAARVAARYEKAPTSFGWRRPALLALAASAGFLLAFLFRSAPPPPPPPVLAVDQKPAWEALEVAHAYGHQNPTDPEGFLARCGAVGKSFPNTDAARAAQRASAAFVAHRCMTPKEDPAIALAALRQEISTALAGARVREEVDRDLARLDEELNAPASREEFGKARGLLEAARAKRPEPRWAGEVDRRLGLLDARVAAQGLSCAAAAKADPAAAKVHRDRVAAWGIGAALAIFDREVGPIQPPPVPAPPEKAEKGMLTLAVIGDIQVKGPAPRTGERVEPPLFLATREGAYCAFRTEGGDVLRVNAGTRVQLWPDRIVLDQGEIFVQAKGAVELTCGGQKVSARNATFEVSLRDQARMVKGPGRTELRVLVLDGQAKVDGRAVGAGELCKAVNGAFEPTGPAENVVLQTQWTHALLKARPEDAGELRVRVAALAALLDDARLAKAAEQALRALGADGASGMLPLLREGKQEHAQRRKLAALVADLAGPEHIPDLVSLLRDHEPGLRADMARGLERLTGQTLGLAKTLWAGSGYERGAQAWEAWLEKSAVTK
ncbi:MAG TPA: zf-HC2 domain-containing protein [Planctomycetota bacterium]